MMTEFDDVLDDFHFAVCKIKELKQQLSVIVKALEAVEWINEVDDDLIEIQYCAWCFNESAAGHRDDCQRQQALALVEGKNNDN